MSISRRQFVFLASAAAVGTSMAPMGKLLARREIAAASCTPTSFKSKGFGSISPKLPLNTADLPTPYRNIPLLSLPEKFQYTAISIQGTTMSDGGIVPGNHDGMACFRGRRGNFILVRNHELNIGGRTTAVNGNSYDSFRGRSGGGGTSTVEVDRQGRVVRDYISLAGTLRNCAGGPTPWQSWLSCEETIITPAKDPRATQRHGYVFEVPAHLGEAVEPIPLVAMGRMNHEAVSVDPQTGSVYETEDRGDGAYYRFIPKQRPSRFGDLQQGGDLYAMVIKPGQRSQCNNAQLPTSLFQATEVIDTRGLAHEVSGSMLPFLGQPLAVDWVKLEDVDPQEDTLRYEALAKGATVWWRGEGAWYSQGKHYWVCSGAGDAGEGQVWCYDPQAETVTLIVESTAENLLDGADNLTIARDGTLYLCEDGSAGTIGNPFDPNTYESQRIVGVDASGGLFNFALNIIPDGTLGARAEFAGVCFSPNGKFMYVNSQGAGITYAIWRTDHRVIQLG